MKVGIVGFAGSGKTTVFNALTGLSASTGLSNKNQTNLGMIKVPDERIDFLHHIYKAKKKTLAEIGFIDIAGKSAEEDKQGLDAKMVAQMREIEALVQVVRAFDNPQLKSPADPLKELQDFADEIIFTDLLQVEARLSRLAKEGKKTPERTLMETLHKHLENNEPLRSLALNPADLAKIAGFRFLSLLPSIALINVAETDIHTPLAQELYTSAEQKKLTLLSMSAKAEAEIALLDENEQQAFLLDLGLTAALKNRFIKTTYESLDLISFLTAGVDECRAWTIKKGTKAKEAAGKIHSDIERGFIKAEVIAFNDFKEHPQESKCKELGKLRLEGKDYLVKDGDIINFKFNV